MLQIVVISIIKVNTIFSSLSDFPVMAAFIDIFRIAIFRIGAGPWALGSLGIKDNLQEWKSVQIFQKLHLQNQDCSLDLWPGAAQIRIHLLSVFHQHRQRKIYEQAGNDERFSCQWIFSDPFSSSDYLFLFRKSIWRGNGGRNPFVSWRFFSSRLCFENDKKETYCLQILVEIGTRNSILSLNRWSITEQSGLQLFL